MNKTKKFVIFNIIWIIAAIALITADRLTKLTVVSKLKGSESITVIKGFLSFTYVENRGAAWGIMSGKISVFVIITLIIVPLLIFVLVRSKQAEVLFSGKKLKYLVLFQLDLILLISGAAGNFIDRVINGYVVDFLEFTFIDFPVFNIADCYITVGAILYIVIYLFLLDDNDLTAILKLKRKENPEKESLRQ